MSNALNVIAQNTGNLSLFGGGTAQNTLSPAAAFLSTFMRGNTGFDMQSVGAALGKLALSDMSLAQSIKQELAPSIANLGAVDRGDFERTFNAELSFGGAAAKFTDTGYASGPFDGLKRALELDYKTNLDPSAPPPLVSTDPVIDEIVVIGRKGNAVTRDDLDMALLSREVYNVNSKGVNGYAKVDAAGLAQLGLNANELLDPKIGLKAALFVQDGEYVLAFAGTDGLSDMGDWEANVLNERNALSEQHNAALRIADKLNKLNIPIRFTGHSLGGGLASLAAASTGQTATTFNSAGIPDSLLAKLSLSRNTISGIAAISHRSDPLGNLQDGRLLRLERPLGRQVQTGSVASNFVSAQIGWMHGIDHVINSLQKRMP